MSKVKIQGNASGTGVLTVTAPNTSTDRTITLPDSTDTLAVNSDVTNKLPLAGGTITGLLKVYPSNGQMRISDSSGDTKYAELEASNGRLFLHSDKGNAEANSDMRFYIDNTEELRITSAGLELQGKIEIESGFEFTAEGGSTRMSIAHNTGNVWIDGNCSAASFTDRTPYPETLQLAYDVINSHKKLPDGQYKADDHSKQLDHSQLHEYVKADDNNRNMSGVISCLVEVIKDLETRIAALES